VGGFAFAWSQPCANVASALRFQLDQEPVKQSTNFSALTSRLSGLKPILAACLSAAALVASPAATITPVPDKVTPVVPDKQDFQVPDREHLTGWVGMRIEAN